MCFIDRHFCIMTLQVRYIEVSEKPEFYRHDYNLNVYKLMLHHVCYLLTYDSMDFLTLSFSFDLCFYQK